MKRLFLLLLFIPSLPAISQTKLEEQWYSLLIEGAAAGYLHQTTWQLEDGRIRTEIEQNLEIQRFGTPFRMVQRDIWMESAQGALLSLRSESDMNGQGRSVEAEVAGAAMHMRVRGAEGGEQVTLPLKRGLRGLQAIDGELLHLIAEGRSGAELDYQLFSSDTLEVMEVRLRILGSGELTDTRGQLHGGVLVEERISSLPGVTTTAIYDRQAQLLYSRTAVGLEMEVLRLQEDPRQSRSGPGGRGGAVEGAAVFDVASLTVAVQGLRRNPPGRIESATIRFRGRGAAILRQQVLQTTRDLGFQPGDSEAPFRVLSDRCDPPAERSMLELHVAATPPVADKPPEAGGSLPPEAAGSLDGGFHLDLEDPRLAELLDRCRLDHCHEQGTAAEPPRFSPACLERLVDMYISDKSLAYGFAGLKEILSGRAGDCTEHALLLVALLRRAGMPSRLAYGLILTELGFIGHAWVELFADGRWQWLDPSFPGNRPYGLKIRLGVMDPAEPGWTALSLALLQVAGSVEAEIVEATLR